MRLNVIRVKIGKQILACVLIFGTLGPPASANIVPQACATLLERPSILVTFEDLMDLFKEEEPGVLEDYLFHAAQKFSIRDLETAGKLADQLVSGGKHYDDGVRFDLFTAFLAGIPDDLLLNAKFDERVMKSWLTSRRAARKLWTHLPARYNQKLMFKFARLRMFKYLYS